MNSRKANYNNGKINYKTENDIASCINASSGAIDISDNIIIDTNRKARCFTAGGNSGGLHSQMDLIQCVAMRGRNPENPKSRVTGLPTEQQLEPRTDGKTNCLTSVQKDNLIEYSFRQDTPIKESKNKFATLRSNGGGKLRGLGLDLRTGNIRRLTPRECGRLQSVPEDKLETLLNAEISDSQLYKMFGNGWNIKVISHILSFLKK